MTVLSAYNLQAHKIYTHFNPKYVDPIFFLEEEDKYLPLLDSKFSELKLCSSVGDVT